SVMIAPARRRGSLPVATMLRRTGRASGNRPRIATDAAESPSGSSASRSAGSPFGTSGLGTTVCAASRSRRTRRRRGTSRTWSSVARISRRRRILAAAAAAVGLLVVREAAREVQALVDGGADAPREQRLDRRDFEGPDRGHVQEAGQGGYRRRQRGDAKGRVADRSLRVDHAVGDLEEALPRGVARGDAPAALDAGDRHDPAAD